MRLQSLSLMTAMLGSLLLFGACATPASKRVDAKMQREEGTRTQAELRQKGYQEILNSKKLSKAQREQMLKLYAETQMEVANVRQRMGKLKGVLFKTLFNPKSKESDISEVKARLGRLNDRKLDIMFDALASARNILGRELDETVLVPFMDPDGVMHWRDNREPIPPHWNRGN